MHFFCIGADRKDNGNENLHLYRNKGTRIRTIAMLALIRVPLLYKENHAIVAWVERA